MAGLSSWTERDVAQWRSELQTASQGDKSRRQKLLSLVTAASSYVAAVSWIQVVQKLGCPPGTGVADLCKEMTGWEMLTFSVYVAGFTLAVIVVVFLLYSLKQRLDKSIQSELDKAIHTVATNVDARESTIVREEKRLSETARLASVAQGKTFDLVSGNSVYACVVMWTLSLHSFTSYTTLSGVWVYFFLMMLLCFFVTLVSFEAAPVLARKLRETFRVGGQERDDWTDNNRLVLVARAFVAAMAWLLAVALVNALEVTLSRYWPGGRPSGVPLCYYSSGLHNVPVGFFAPSLFVVSYWQLITERGVVARTYSALRGDFCPDGTGSHMSQKIQQAHSTR
jgi:hypothetical protein